MQERSANEGACRHPAYSGAGESERNSHQNQIKRKQSGTLCTERGGNIGNFPRKGQKQSENDSVQGQCPKRSAGPAARHRLHQVLRDACDTEDVSENRGNGKMLFSLKLHGRPEPQQGVRKNGKSSPKGTQRLTRVPACWAWRWSQDGGSARRGWGHPSDWPFPVCAL